MLRNVVWTAVATAGAVVGSLISAGLGSLNFTIAFGSAAVASSMLSLRER